MVGKESDDTLVESLPAAPTLGQLGIDHGTAGFKGAPPIPAQTQFEWGFGGSPAGC